MKISTLLIALLLATSCASHKFEKRSIASQYYSPILDEDSDDFKHAKKGKHPLYSFTGIYSNGEYTPLFDLIRAAKESIDIEIYEMADADVLSELSSAIRERGVRVRIVKDPTPVNSTCDVFAPADEGGKPDNPKCAAQKKLLAEVRASEGGVYVPFVKAELCGQFKGQDKGKCFEHGKMVIVDGTVALISTGNFNSSNLCNQNQKPSTCNRDFSYVTRDKDVIAGLKNVFESDLTQKRYDLKELLTSNPDLAAKMTVSPYSLEPLVQFVNSAQASLKIQNQYLKETGWNNAIIDAAKRGVKVEMMLTSACSFGPPSETEKRKLSELYKKFENAGVQLRFFTKKIKIKNANGYLHSKVMIADGAKAWVGSVNGSTSAVSRNREFGIFFNQPKRVQELENVLDRDFREENSETWQETLACAKDR